MHRAINIARIASTITGAIAIAVIFRLIYDTQGVLQGYLTQRELKSCSIETRIVIEEQLIRRGIRSLPLLLELTAQHHPEVVEREPFFQFPAGEWGSKEDELVRKEQLLLWNGLLSVVQDDPNGTVKKLLRIWRRHCHACVEQTLIIKLIWLASLDRSLATDRTAVIECASQAINWYSDKNTLYYAIKIATSYPKAAATLRERIRVLATDEDQIVRETAHKFLLGIVSENGQADRPSTSR